MYKKIKGLDINGKMMRVGNTYIFIDPNPMHGPFILDIAAALSRGSRRIHIIYTNPDAVVLLPVLVDRIVNDPNDLLKNTNNSYDFANLKKLVIHISKNFEDLETLFWKYADCMSHYEINWKFTREPGDIRFAIPNNNRCDKDCIRAATSLVIGVSDHALDIYVEVENYWSCGHVKCGYTSKNFNGCGAIVNRVQAAHPEMFKDRIISRFKDITPESILKNFKDDDDIWEYITNNDEWE